MEEKKQKTGSKGLPDESPRQDGLFPLPGENEQPPVAQSEDGGRSPSRGICFGTGNDAPFAHVLLDKNGLIKEVSAAAADLLARESELLTGNSFGAFVTPRCRPEFFAHIKRTVGKAAADQCELEILGEGSPRFVRLESSSLAQNGRVDSIHSAIIDITDQKKSEALLRESEERYSVLAERTNDGVALVKEGRLLSVNPRYCEIFGCSDSEEALRRGLRSIVAAGEQDRFFEILERKNRKGDRVPLRFDFKGLRANGAIAYIEACASLTVMQGEQAILLTFTDITERKQAEEERKRLALIVERAAEMILVVDREGMVQYVNGTFLQIIGRKRDEAIGKHIRECAGAEDKGFYEGLWARLQKERKWNGRMTLTRPDGRFLELDISLSPMRDSTGLPLNYVIVCRDVTTEVVLERQLRQIQKMQAIQTLAGGIAHDFNNLLAAIVGNVELALDDVPPDNPAHRNLEQIFKASRRGKDLVKQILLFSRRDQQESVLVEVGPLVAETLKLLRSSIPAGIDIRQRVEPGRDAVLADAGRLQQILMNLVSNAVYAMRGSGVLEVAVGEYVIAEGDAALPDLTPGAYLNITVSDTGDGMSKEVMDRVFEPFFTTKRPGEGPGMGLAVVHGIVKGLKGAITVSSEPQKGSTFTVYLPIAAGAAQRAVKEESKPLPPGKERILFVDDETPIIEMNIALLERLGYQVSAEESSVKALDLFAAEPDAFDLVITDQAMPELSGIELAERIRSIRSNIPIIIITGFSETIDAERARKMGIRQFLMKPVVRSELAEAIRKVLDRPEKTR